MPTVLVLHTQKTLATILARALIRSGLQADINANGAQADVALVEWEPAQAWLCRQLLERGRSQARRIVLLCKGGTPPPDYDYARVLSLPCEHGELLRAVREVATCAAVRS